MTGVERSSLHLKQGPAAVAQGAAGTGVPGLRSTFEEAIQRREQGKWSRIAIRRIASHHLADYGFQLERDVGPELARRDRRFMLASQEFFQRRPIAGEGFLSREHPVKGAAQGVDVGADV